MDERLLASFGILGLHISASPEEVKEAHRDLVQVWHPDRFCENERLRLKAEERLKEINFAIGYIKMCFDAGWQYDESDDREPFFEELVDDDAPTEEEPQDEDETQDEEGPSVEPDLIHKANRGFRVDPVRLTVFLGVIAFAGVITLQLGSDLTAPPPTARAAENSAQATDASSLQEPPSTDVFESAADPYDYVSFFPTPAQGEDDWYVIVGSFPREAFDSARSRLDEVREVGFRVGIVETDQRPELSPGLLAVAVGPDSEGVARTNLELLRTTYAAAYIKRIKNVDPDLPRFTSHLSSASAGGPGAAAKAVFRARIHKSPDKSSTVLYRVLPGTELLIQAAVETGWVRVALGDGDWGYVLASQVSLLEPMPDKPPQVTLRPDPYADIVPPRLTTPANTGGGYGGYAGTGGGHWIQSVSDDGDIIVLEDGSTWRVDPIDTVDSALWLPVDDVIVRESSSTAGGYLIINTDQGEKVGAKYLGR